MTGGATADEAVRVRLGAAAGTPPEQLERLAADPAAMVRAALVLNPAIPPAAERVLAQDPDPRVRALLARRLAALAPTLSASEQGRLQHQAYATLAALVEDAAAQVRAAIADVMQAMPDAPRELILRLAADCTASVSEPVLRFSPLLTEADLLALIAAPPSPDTALAIARRPALQAQVADAIAAGGDHEAIRALLANASAQIREATLDGLIARAAAHVAWHEPLVRRPLLSARAVRALAGIVATHLLDALAHRADLDPLLAGELQRRLQDRLATAAAADADDATAVSGVTQAAAEAQRIAHAGRLTEATLLAAIQRGEPALAGALLAMATAMPGAAIDRAVVLRSAKALVALAWKAGFSMTVATALQTALARIGPADLLAAGPRGGFPLSAEEMHYQLDLLRRGDA